METTEARKIISAVQKIVTSTAPGAKEKAMYGGLVYELHDTKPKRLFCGVFVRMNYVTIELDRGAELKDDMKLLEGSGKNRRHVTVRTIDEIKTKQVKDFITQSFLLTS